MELNVISFYLLYHPKRKGHFGFEMTVGLPAVEALILLFKRIMNRFPEGKIKKLRLFNVLAVAKIFNNFPGN
jgi:hypothetical protein